MVYDISNPSHTIITIPLNVTRTNQEYIIDGKGLIVMSMTGQANATTIKIDSINNGAIDPTIIRHMRGDIKKLFITNDSGSGGELVLLIPQTENFEANAALAVDTNNILKVNIAAQPANSAIDVEQVANSGLSLAFISDDQTASLAPSASETITITPPTGYIYEVKQLKHQVNAVPSSTSGTHKLQVNSSNITHLEGSSNYNTGLQFNFGYWLAANASSYPPNTSNPQGIIETIILDENNPLTIIYTNNTDATQTGTRIYRLTAKKIRITKPVV